jgi:hypothetical protein
MIKEYETEVIIDGIPYAVACELELEVVDEGIGGYEYWGSKGTDHHYVWDLANYSFEAYDDKENLVEDLVLKVKIAFAVEKKILNYISELPIEDESRDDEEDTY